MLKVKGLYEEQKCILQSNMQWLGDKIINVLHNQYDVSELKATALCKATKQQQQAIGEISIV